MKLRGVLDRMEGALCYWSPGMAMGSDAVVRVDAETAPAFGDDDGVAGVARVEAHLHGEIDADVADVLAQGADVLGALVGDAGGAVAVDEGVGHGTGDVAGPVGLGDAAVDDAAGGGEQLAAIALDLLGREGLAGEHVGGKGSDGRKRKSDASEDLGRPEDDPELRWDGDDHDPASA